MLGVFAVTTLLAGGGRSAQVHKTHPKAAAFHPSITMSQANDIAVKKHPGKVLREVMVDAKTGKTDSVEVTTPAKERTEAKAEAAKGKTPAKPAPKTHTVASHPRTK